jgi:TupA-like ATPgrasp
VIKSSHANGHIIIINDGNEANWRSILVKCSEWLNLRDYGSRYFEWGSGGVDPGIIVEQFIGINGVAPNDYKFYVFDGCVRMIAVEFERHENYTQAFFTKEWQRIPFRRGRPPYVGEVPPPKSLDAMIGAAEN